MTLLALICGWITVAVFVHMAWTLLRSTDAGLGRLGHRVDMLPRVLIGRYTGMGLMALALTLHGDLVPLAILFTGCTFMGFFDGAIYARARLPHLAHTLSGVASGVALAVTLVAIWANGPA